jgi:acetyl/propionyl-CoA carboxylase alpha subunit/acetyl-CoA carboxylase carboxyltransferase component
MSAARPIRCLGVVNRGEAAMRCIRAVKTLRARERSDLRAVALYTDVDRDAPFVRHADAAVRLPAPAGEVRAYLDHDLLLDALRRAGADAVWPGWGFVAEDPVFADRVAAAGLCFLGPSGDAMRALGDKIAAKRLAAEAGVPIAAWSGGAVTDERAAMHAAATIGFPLVVKAAAGGGGRGIRVVDDASALPAAWRSAAAEARSAFGDDRLFLERRIAGARHVEVQVVGDAHGHVVALGTRDCSVQRRHQKLIEETPPPGLAPTLLAGLCAASVRLASLVRYVGVGTVEFLVVGEEAWFLEMNPRLQVEHGITEAVTGLDLVELQIRIGRGDDLAGLAWDERGAAIEARVCAEDPEAGFVPTPGRVARFDPALGPGIRIDTGVVAGSLVPPAFDSLVAKVIASGPTREDARSRLVCALRDLDLVVQGGASNAGYLIEVLDSAEFRHGGVDTGWIDRRRRAASTADRDASDALVAAAILAYQRRRRDARTNFFADTTNVSLRSVPPSAGQEVDLSFDGVSYRLAVFALGSWRYRVHLDGRAATVALREGDGHLARLELGDRSRRVLFDATDVGLRLELDGRPHRVGWETVGHVRAVAPALVVGVQVEVGEHVVAGQILGFLEAMKVEIGFAAPIAGVVREIRAGKGQLVAAGDVLVVIEPGSEGARDGTTVARTALGPQTDPLGALLDASDAGDLTALDAAGPAARRRGLAALRDEIRAVLLGYDVDSARAERIIALVDATDPGTLSDALRADLGALSTEIVVAFADLERLFVTAPQASGGDVRPSNAARLRAYVRRVRAGGAGVAEEFLCLVRTALGHYGIRTLDYGDGLERALLRLLATQNVPARRRLVLALLRCLAGLAANGGVGGADPGIADALERIGAMRGLVDDALADAAIEAHAVLVDQPALERQADLVAARLAPWLAAPIREAGTLPSAVLLDLAAAPRRAFDQVGQWLFRSDPRRQGVALTAWLLRWLAPDERFTLATLRCGAMSAQRIDLADRRVVVAATVRAGDAAATAEALAAAVADGTVAPGRTSVHAIELVVRSEPGDDGDEVVAAVARVLTTSGLPAERATLSSVRPDGDTLHRTLVAGGGGVQEDARLLGLHPETAARVGLARLEGFALERLAGPDDVYCFRGRGRTIADDERLFVLADVRGRSGSDDATERHVAAFERVFHHATSALRALRSARDARRRLHWNRITIAVAPAVALQRSALEGIARRLAPATRHLGLEKVVIRLHLRDGSTGTAGAAVELVASDLTGSHMELAIRRPETAPLSAATAYARRVVEARRRRLVHPYEVVRMLTARNGGASPPVFEEHDLDSTGDVPRAISVGGRPYGENAAGVVFGILTTPTEKVPEGLRRVLVLSDPTRDMGALAAPECDRLVAALDLAEAHGLPVEWIPISAGARIAMTSGTENLDATARVARRIITFTAGGGVVHLVVYGVNVGAQSYWNALATMVARTRGALVMTPDASMVLTGCAALEASGGVAAEDEVALGGFERVMGPNGEAHYYAPDLAAATRLVEEHYRYTYVVPGEDGPRRHHTSDPPTRDVTTYPYPAEHGHGFATVGELFDDATNPGRKRPFAMRAVMAALIDQDGGHLERWRSWAGAESAIVWDAHLGGTAVCLVGIESQAVPREGHRPADGPAFWTAGALFPRSSKKVARALEAASGNRPAVILANLSGFDGSPESLRKLQLEHGAEIARAVVSFDGPIVFLVVSRYHGGAYVVFSKSLNPRLRVMALTGSYASVIGGSAASTVVFAREVRARATADERVRRAREALRAGPSPATRHDHEAALAEATREAQAAVAEEFDAVHTVERARRVGSIDAIVAPHAMRPALIRALHERPHVRRAVGPVGDEARMV